MSASKTHELCIIHADATGIRHLVRIVCPHDCPSAYGAAFHDTAVWVRVA